MKTPYVGITGFMTKDEALDILSIVPVNSNRLVMIGVLASQKTIQGIPNKWPNRYPTMDNIAGIFPDDPRALNLIHYNTKESDTLVDQLLTMTAFAGKNLHGFQLNIAWPSPDAIKEYREAQPEKQIVLQIGGHAFKMMNNSPIQLAAKVTEYEGIIDYVLLDPSGGLGIPLNPERIREYLYTLQEKKLDIGLGTAGGLGPTTLHLLEPLAKEFPDLSTDAEGRLYLPEGRLNINASREYARKSLLMFP